eukprot:CAMPEP_0170225766 /NCGR_PEP_ID=MMETSP0116_2-20130129/12593_1 /TAXON_ID=400756 /ORGANISM="Durinskia baltica, Strain CSIRO CS-38" /LENGTH=730 /DNA_ID=CAMNT_0010476489 /DNA_START=17 /DNA_END=2209 /DNA_ORIENTATION=-
MESAGGFASNAAPSPDMSAESVLRSLAPECAPAVVARLRRERVWLAADLARLDKEDLRDLGFNMLERSRVLAWARSVAVPPPAPPDRSRATSSPGGARTPGGVFGAEFENFLPRRRRSGFMDEDPGLARSTSQQIRLERVEQQADFWCSLASSWSSPLVTRCRRAIEGVNLREVRESLLESLFDLSHERVKEVYECMVAEEDTEARSDAAAAPAISVSQLRQGLAQYGLPEPNGDALHQLLEAVVESKGACIQLAEFETILSRLTLAQLVMLLEGDQRTGPRGVAFAASKLFVVDYGVRTFEALEVASDRFRRFFFGHRPPPQARSDPPNVRWVHMKGLDLTLLLALSVKYSLHPLAVEDTIEQAPSKADRHGPHYFLTVEGLCLSGLASEAQPVRGYHVAVFAAGPPTSDTVISFAQPDASFAEDWPDDWPAGLTATAAAGGLAAAEADGWASKIRSALSQPLSRARERRADYFLYKVLDVCTDEIMIVIRAYIARLGWLEGRLHAMLHKWPRNCLSEVMLIRRQLYVISRRVRGLQRAVRKLIDDRDLSLGLNAYLQDIIEHMDEVTDDCERLAAKCGAMAEEFDRARERERERRKHVRREQTRRQEMKRSVQADRQNRTLFVLTVVTTIFTPMQFLSGVYGMNFVDEAGTPTIPELLWKQGYRYFWMVVSGYLTLAILVAVTLTYCSNCAGGSSSSDESSGNTYSDDEESGSQPAGYATDSILAQGV